MTECNPTTNRAPSNGPLIISVFFVKISVIVSTELFAIMLHIHTSLGALHELQTNWARSLVCCCGKTTIILGLRFKNNIQLGNIRLIPALPQCIRRSLCSILNFLNGFPQILDSSGLSFYCVILIQ